MSVQHTGASRVTLDIDDDGATWTLAATRAYHELSDAADSVEVRVSSSGSGIHLIGWFDDPLTDEQKDRLRRHLGDDKDRIMLDTMRRRVGHSTNVLWTNKGGDEPATGFRDIYAALDHIRLSEGAQHPGCEALGPADGWDG
jgi:hypothetical protein